MIISSILLAFSVSIDALTLGITYGIKNSKISNSGNLIIFTIAFISTALAMLLGNWISALFSPNISVILGSLLLLTLGIYTIFKSIKLNPSTYDVDNSNTIDRNESILLALAISVDASCVGLSCGIIGINGLLYPFLAALFHMFWLNLNFYWTIQNILYIKKKSMLSAFLYLSFIDNNFDIPFSSIVTPYTVSAASIVPFLCVIIRNCVFFEKFFRYSAYL